MLILPLHVTHNLLTHTIVAFNVVHTTDAAGRPIVTQGPNYNITDANLQPAGDDAVALLPEGAQTDGALVLHTAMPVYAATNVNGAEQNTQTYIRHTGNIWKLWRIQDWTPHAKLKRYILTRYVDVDGVIA